MAQLDVFRLEDGMLVVDLQTNLIGLEATRIVAPLLAEGRCVAFPDLTPVVTFEGKRWVARIQQLSAVPAHILKNEIGSLRDTQDALLRTIGILTHGF
ncbi:MAG TPA: CcdB family protein [Paracoccaceae bacterium]|nr:CcdB family protein [Paracoccaceae bacterium]